MRDILTRQILRTLAEGGPGASLEIAAELECDTKTVAGAISNMRNRRQWVTNVGRVPRARGWAFLYDITDKGRAHLRRIG